MTSQTSFLGLAVVEVTPATRATALGIIGAMVCICAGMILFGGRPGTHIYGILPLLLGSVIVTELFLAHLLLGQFASARLCSLLLIGVAYLFVGLVTLAYVLTCPLIFGQNGVFQIQWAGALLSLDGVARRLSALCSRLARIRSDRAEAVLRTRGQDRAASCSLICVGAAIGALAFLTHPLVRIPSLVVEGRFSPVMMFVALPGVGFLDCLGIAVIALRTRMGSVAALWLVVALAASLLDTAIGMLCARYSYGWYAANLFSLVAASVMLAAFVYELSAIQARLAALNDLLININEEDRRAARERLTFLAFHDHLTSLENRSRWQARLGERIAQESSGNGTFSILFIDLDHFKEINDSAGHPVGDRVLVEAARRLQETLRNGDEIARFGGDEFVVMAAAGTDTEGVRALAQRLRERIRAPFVFEERSFHVTASVGIASLSNRRRREPNPSQPCRRRRLSSKECGRRL